MSLKIKKSTRDTQQKQEALASVIKDEQVKINFFVPRDLKKEMKMFATENGITVTELSISAIKNYLSNFSND